MKGEGLRAFGFFSVVLFLGVVAYATLPALLGAASGPEGELLTLIKSEEAEGLRIPVPGTAEMLRSQSVHFDRITITVAPDGKSAEAVATLDFNGGLGSTKVSSLGYEKLRFVREGRSWTPQSGYAPRLVGIVQALERRRRGLAQGSPETLRALTARADAGLGEELEALLAWTGREYTARAWYIRSERDEVTVTEDATVKGSSPERPIHEERTRRLVLQALPAGEFFFPRGLL